MRVLHRRLIRLRRLGSVYVERVVIVVTPTYFHEDVLQINGQSASGLDPEVLHLQRIEYRSMFAKTTSDQGKYDE
jgi:hypothetical protein